jgi:hypothetical protein
MAERTLRERRLAPSDDFSPAEAFAGLAEAVAAARWSPKLPADRKTAHPLGPKEGPPIRPETARVSYDDAIILAQGANDHIAATGALPASLRAAGARVGTGSLFALFSEVYLDLDAGRRRAEYDVPEFEAYPATDEAPITAEIESYKSWPVHKPDLDMSRIVEFTRLQLWTLKPAHRSR